MEFAYFVFCLTTSQHLIQFGIPEISVLINWKRFSNYELGIQFITVESVELACFNLINIKTCSTINLHEIYRLLLS